MMNSNSIIPKWNFIQQCNQEQSQEEEDSSHVQLQNHQNHNHLLSMSDNRIRELIWENGQPTESGFSGMNSRSNMQGGFNNNIMRGNSGVDTLESIVDQATKNGRKWGELVENDPAAGLLFMKKRLKSSQKYQICSAGHNDLEYSNSEEVAEGSTCDTTTTMLMESIRSVKTTEDDSATCHAEEENQDVENQTKQEATGSHQTRSSRAADTHKQSERKRRDRINQKMKALQKLVPNACKTDKASMLDEVIEYMKQLKAQVNMMVSSGSVNDQIVTMMMMMMPSLGMQQQLQMSSLLARMATSTSSPIHHQSFVPLIHPGMITSQAPPPVIGTQMRNSIAIANSLPQNNEYYYGRLLAQQCMNMDLYNNMRGLCTHQSAERSQKTSNDEVKYGHRQI